MISGEAGETWLLVREDEKWTLYHEQIASSEATIIMDQEVAWRLFTKGIDRTEAEKSIIFEGNRSLGLPILDTVSIIT